MITIEPCCAHKHWKQVLHELETSKTVVVNGYGDMTLSELLPVVLERYSQTDVILAVPYLPDGLMDTLKALLHRTWALPQGGNVPVVARMRIITDARDAKSPGALEWAMKEDSPPAPLLQRGERGAETGGEGSGRVEVASTQQNDVALVVMPGERKQETLVIHGAVNVRPSGEWSALVSRDAVLTEELRRYYEERFKAWKVKV